MRATSTLLVKEVAYTASSNTKWHGADSDYFKFCFTQPSGHHSGHCSLTFTARVMVDKHPDGCRFGGWTSLAQQSDNILARKYTTSSAAGGRGSWEFDCGGASDRYIIFADRAQAIDFVAKQLATSENYADATARYREERTKGVSTAEAVETWVDGIADPYSSRPEAYRTAIKRVMNDPSVPPLTEHPMTIFFASRSSVQTRGNAV